MRIHVPNTARPGVHEARPALRLLAHTLSPARMSLEKSSKIHGSFRRLPALSQYFPIKEIKDSTIDIQATCRLTNLYLKQMAEKPD
jgi:hypothetical protein